MKHKQLFLVILAFLMTGVSIVLLNSSQVIGAMAGGFLMVVGACATNFERPSLPWPEPPASEKVTSLSRPDGLLLFFDEYLELEGSIIELRRYIDEQAQIEFYTGEIDEHRR